MKTAVITPVHGRHDHLQRQEQALAALDPPPQYRVVISMADPQIPALVGPGTTVVVQPAGDAGLPLSAARNRGALVARRAGAELLIFLDVDCL
ncbi:MAG: glycosyltransferase family 2 protein, partial [Propionibacteriaceae bacterium]